MLHFSIHQAVPGRMLWDIVAFIVTVNFSAITSTANLADKSNRDNLLNPGHWSKRQVEGIGEGNSSFYDYRKAQTQPLPSQVSGDAPWTQSEKSYQSTISCPLGIQNKERGIVFLVPGTGSNARETYVSSPYFQLLPSNGFDLCWIDTPNYSTSDTQLTAEFVAYGIKYLAVKSTATGGKINIVSWSQGGANVQWASTFWPSIRKHVIGHVALAPSMKGTSATILLCPVLSLAGGCLPSVLQQSTGSFYMKAANSQKDQTSAAYALIPTTIIYTYTDEIVTPQIGSGASSRLLGASNIGIQDICGSAYNVGHFSIVADVAAYGVALNALLGGRPAQPSTVDLSYCKKTAASLGFAVGNLANDLKIAFRIAIGDSRVQMIASQYLTLRLAVEPYLQQYVCDRGYATSRCTRNGFKDAI